MRKEFLSATILVLFMGIACFSQDDVFSPTTADSFLETAISLYSEPNATTAQAKQAMVFLDAISAVEPKSDYILPYAVGLAWKFPQLDFSNTIQNLLVKYADDTADLEVVRLAVQYVVERFNYREQRERYYQDMLKLIGMRNKALGSEISTQLGLLAAERADQENAEAYLMQAYNGDPFNETAFKALLESSSQPMPAALYVRHLRMMMIKNPYDIEAAFAFANETYAIGLYEIAANGFEYCWSLFKELHPGDSMPFAIYRPWALSCLNDPKKLSECGRIAQLVRASGQFDIVIEAIAGAAAQKLGNTTATGEILAAASAKAEQLATQNAGAKTIRAQDLAWFYCFGNPDAAKALEWANKANSNEPNSAAVSSIMAYALAMNSQNEVAATLADQYAASSQVAGIAKGIAMIASDANAGLTEIKNAIAMNAGSLEAARAKAFLEEKGSVYVPPAEIGNLAKSLQSEFGEKVVSDFTPADKLFSAKLSAIGTDFSYGSTFSVNLAVTNNSQDPMIISDDGLFKGVVRVDATVLGDLRESIPNLVLKKFRPSESIESNQSMFIPLRLMTGQLRDVLLNHPQANLKVEFTAYLDPVVDANGAVRSGFAGMAPLKLTITQTGVNISGPYLQNRLNSLSKGQPGQKIKTAQLFTGLLTEYYSMAGKKAYRMRDIEPELLRSALVKCLQDDNWSVRVETALGLVETPLDYQLQEALSLNLADSYWPVRMTALWLLGRSSDESFTKVLDWTAANDTSSHVVEMAVALGAKSPKKAEPAPQPAEPKPAQGTIVPAPSQGMTAEPNTVEPNAAQPEIGEPETEATAQAPEPNEIKAAEPNTSEPNAATAVEEDNSTPSVADMLGAAEPNTDANGI